MKIGKNTQEERFIMKKMRKGFTLVELLIVVAILATLTAVMMMSFGNSTAKAKAATIASNVNACRNAAMAYPVTHGADGLASLTADDVLFASLPSWKDFNNDNNTIKYAALTADGNKGYDNWAITVDFSGDPEKDGIAEALQKINGYNMSYASANATGVAIVAPNTAASGSDSNGKYAFQVTLTTGKIENYTAAP